MAVKKIENKEVVKKVEKKDPVKKTPVVSKPQEKDPVKKNKDKVVSAITIMDNDTLKKLFQDNGCITRTNANNASNVVYNTFGTQSRVLQQKRAYQLLLTNGHKATKSGVVDTDNDDVKRFTEWYNTLTDEQRSWVVGYDSMMATTLSHSELPRERTVKLTNYDLLVQFIKYMGSFKENQVETKNA